MIIYTKPLKTLWLKSYKGMWPFNLNEHGVFAVLHSVYSLLSLLHQVNRGLNSGPEPAWMVQGAPVQVVTDYAGKVAACASTTAVWLSVKWWMSIPALERDRLPVIPHPAHHPSFLSSCRPYSHLLYPSSSAVLAEGPLTQLIHVSLCTGLSKTI